MITRAQYVKRLERMLRVDKPCNHCPVRKGAKFDGNFLESCIKAGWSFKVDRRVCDMCMDFVSITAGELFCPCNNVKRKSTALKRAGKAILAYKAGEHKWNKEGK